MNRGLTVLTALVLVSLVLAPLTVSGAAGGVEFNIVDVWVPSSLYGQLGVYALPFNVSDPSLLSFSTMYIIDEGGRPYYSYLFSNSPPLAVWVDGGISSKTFSIFYGGSNPYPDYVATPGGSVPLFAAYDDYDYDSGLWIYSGGHSISQSQLSLTGRMTLNTSYTPGVYALWLVRFGGYGTLIQLYSPKGYAGWVYLHLDSSNFGDWGSIRDGTDIYFTDIFGNPLNYTIAHLDKAKQEADIFFYTTMNPGETKLVYMFYGRDNPYPEYNTPITWPITAVDITPRPKPTTYPQTTYKIIGYQPVTIKPVTLNITNIDLTQGDVLAPHLYDWYFDGIDDYVYFSGFNTPNFIQLYVEVGYNELNSEDLAKPFASWSEIGPSIFFGTLMSPPRAWFEAWNSTSTSFSVGRIASFSFAIDFGVYHRVGVYYNGSWFFSYVDGSYVSSYDPSAYGYDADGPIANIYKLQVSGFGQYRRLRGIIGYILFANNKPVNPTVDTTIEDVYILVDPTFFDGTNYFDLVSGVAGTPYGGVQRVPADVAWLWVVRGLEDDGFVHLRFFPVGSVVRFVDSVTNETVATVYVGGLGNGAGLVPDLWVPLPSGTYDVYVETYVATGSSGASGDTSVWTGLSLYTGAPWTSLTRDQTIKTANGGTIYIEYVDANHVVAWLQPSPYTNQATDYTTSETGYKPFPYTNDYTTTTNTRTLSTAWKPIHLTTNITINNNKITIAPHLYNWYFNGTGYIEILDSPSIKQFNEQSIEVLVYHKIIVSTYIEKIIQKYNWDYWIDTANDYLYYRIKDPAGNIYGVYTSWAPYKNNGFHHIVGVYDGQTMYLYIDAVLKDQNNVGSFTIRQTTGNLAIGYNNNYGTQFWHGYIGFTRIYNRTLSDVEIGDAYNSHVVNASGLVLFLDPTFFNGTHYIDLSGYGNHGTPYGGVSRVEAGVKWLWVVVNGTDSSNSVVFKWFPENTIVVIKNATTGEVVTTLGVPPGGQGIEITLDPGNYTIEAIIYPPGTYKVITQTLTIQANDAIAPHLYDWYLDGIDDYIIYDIPDWSASSGSWYVEVMDRMVDVGYSPNGLGDSTGGWWYMYLFQYGRWYKLSLTEEHSFNDLSYRYSIARLGNDTQQILSITFRSVDVGYDNSVWVKHIINYYFDNGNQTIYRKAILQDGTVIEATATASEDFGTVTYDILYVGQKPTPPYEKPSIVLSYLYMEYNDVPKHLIDPTFFNGTHYIDLISGVTGTPYGGIQRVLSNNIWLWHVVGVAGDGYVHFRFFPKGTVIRLYSTGGVLKYVFYIDGVVNGAGLVEDYRVSVKSGTYIVEAVVPVWGPEDNIGVSMASVSYSGSRDGYSLQLSVSVDLPPVNEGLFNTSILVSPSMYGVDRTSAPLPVYVWGGVPVYNVTGSTGLGVVFEARIYASSNWSIGVLNMTSNAYTPGYTGDLSPVVVVYGYNNETYLYYGLDNVVVDTGLSYNASSWVYVYIELRPDGSIVVGVGPGDYVGGGIYDTVYTYTYTPVNWEPMYVAFGVGVFTRYSGSYTLYIDWLRMRPSTTGRFSVTATAKKLWYSGEEILLLNGTSGNWTTYIDLVDVEAFELTFYGVNGTYRIVYGSIVDAYGSSQSYVVAEATGTLALYNGTAVLNSTLVSPPPLTGYLVVSYNASWLEVGLLESNKYTVLLGYPVNESFHSIAKLLFAKQSTGSAMTPRYTLGAVAGYNMLESITQTIAPTTPGSTNIYKLGFTYNTTVNNATYTAEWGILVNGTTVQLYIDENGTVTALDLGTAKTPMIVGIGYDFENTTKRLSVFGMIVWSESLGDKLVTKYLSRYIDVTMNASIEWATPFAEALNDPLLVDRFGLTLGWLMNQIIRGNIVVQISGYYPVGGLIKYVSITSPIKIRIVNGNIVVEPASTAEGTIVLEGFQGWTLNLAIYGADVSDVQITSDPYVIDFPTGFTAVIVADISARKISIVSATPPSMIGTGQVPTGQQIVAPVISAPRFTHVYGPAEIINTIILGATLVASAIVATRLTGNIGDGLVIAGFVATIMFLLLGDYMNMSVATMVMIVGFAVRKALST